MQTLILANKFGSGVLASQEPSTRYEQDDHEQENEVAEPMSGVLLADPDGFLEMDEFENFQRQCEEEC